MPEAHNVFVAHRHEDDAKIEALKNLLQGKGVEMRSSSITSDRPNNARNDDYIKQGILRPKIEWAGKVIVLITPDTKNHDWVEWEIVYASRRDKRVIGVWAHGSAGCAVPDALEQHGHAVVGWNADRIIRALNGERIWDDPNGVPRGPQYISRIECR
ncbi:MAG: TIR domain-containing protein [Acidimicrobiaceae bacterium]|nr:TIR domain-containing protein [Acidimicrobiaceae bacterium]